MGERDRAGLGVDLLDDADTLDRAGDRRRGVGRVIAVTRVLGGRGGGQGDRGGERQNESCQCKSPEMDAAPAAEKSKRD